MYYVYQFRRESPSSTELLYRPWRKATIFQHLHAMIKNEASSEKYFTFLLISYQGRSKMIILIKRYSRRKEPSMKCKHLKKTSSVLVLCLRVKRTTLYVEAD